MPHYHEVSSRLSSQREAIMLTVGKAMEELKKEPKFQTTGKPGNWSPKWQDGMPAPGV